MYPTLQVLFENGCEDFEAQLVEFNGEADHAHLLVNYPPKVALAKLVYSLKGVSSRKLKQAHPEVQKRYYQSALWSPSYFAASCGGASIEIIRQTFNNNKHQNSRLRRHAYIPALKHRVLRLV